MVDMFVYATIYISTYNSLAGGRHNMSRLAHDLDLRPFDLENDLLTWKVVSESRVSWATCVSNLISLCLSVLDLGPMYAIDVRRQTDRRQIDVRCQTASSLNAPSAGCDKRYNIFCFIAVAYTTLDRLSPVFTFS